MSQMARIKRARTQLLLNHPFFGYLATKLRLVETEKFPTMATDGRHLFFNPKFTAKLSDGQTLTGVGHEALHCASEHFDRQGSRESERWKKSADYSINPLLVDAGFTPIVIPGVFEWLFDSKFRKNTAEAIYEQLPPEPPGSGGCGCVLIPGSRPVDDGDGDSVEDPNQPPPVNWKRAVVEAAQFAKTRGPLPAGVEEMVDGIIHPRVDWRRVIRAQLSRTNKKTDWTWRRPNRRYAPQGIILPTPFGYTTAAECWLDSSGSVPSDAFKAFMGGIVEIAKQLRIQLNVGVCDAQVNLFVENVRDSDVRAKVRLVGRGGTDFRPAFEHVRRHRRRIDTLIYFTDGWGTFPENKPPYQVIWAMPDSSKDVQVPFGQKLLINFQELMKEAA